MDKSNVVASAVLVSACHLVGRDNAEVVKRWTNEIQEAMNSKQSMVQVRGRFVPIHRRRHAASMCGTN